MTAKDFGVRDGELAAELPARPDAGLDFIAASTRPGKSASTAPRMRANPTRFAPSNSMRAGATITVTKGGGPRVADGPI